MAVHEMTASTLKEVRKKFPEALIVRPMEAVGTKRRVLVFDEPGDALGHPSGAPIKNGVVKAEGYRG